KKIGDVVRKGEVLAFIDAAEIGRAKADFLQAIAQFQLKSAIAEQLKRSSASVPPQRLLEAETAVSEARIRLLSTQQAMINLGIPVDGESMKGLTEQQLAARVQFLGLPDAVVQSLDPKTTTANLLPVKAALDGVVVSREVVAGEVVDVTKVLFVI